MALKLTIPHYQLWKRLPKVMSFSNYIAFGNHTTFKTQEMRISMEKSAYCPIALLKPYTILHDVEMLYVVRFPDDPIILVSSILLSIFFYHKSIASECRERGGTVIPVHCDHSNPEDVEELFKQIDDENGGQLDILVNSAFSATAVRCVFLYFSLNIVFRT